MAGLSTQATTERSHLDRLAGAARAIAGSLVRDPERRAARLGEIFLACEAAAADRPAEFHAALARDALEPFLLPHVRESLSREDSDDGPRDGPRGGWFGTYVGPDARPIEDSHEDNSDADALDLSRRALERACADAREQGNTTLLRNLRWYRERLGHKSYESIARAEGRIPATVRTGVARARKLVLRVVHELQHAQPAPLSGDAPPELARLRQLWVRQELDALEDELERSREAFGDDPHWLNVAALFAADRGHPERAAELYERGLVQADAPDVRGRLLNNLGNLVEDCGRPDDARVCWMRAHQLVPHAPAPLMNLLAAASSSEDYASAQHHLAELGDLLSSGRLDDDERAYVRRRLADHPKLGWLRDTDAWRVGPARWLRSWGRGAARVLALATAIALALLAQPAIASAAAPPPRVLTVAAASPAPEITIAKITIAKKGGDSMGKPRRRFEPVKLAGDSMGRSGGKPRGKGRPPS
jgi:tetratricopeptide (TPR) repeat protein